MPADLLSDRALNRATLARQQLLVRSDRTPLAMIEHLVGMQAQVPGNPYIGLWSRLVRFDPEIVSQLLETRKVVRIVVMRGTIHLVSADDCLRLRPLVQPVLDRELARHSEFGAAIASTDVRPVLAFARRLLARQPQTGTQLRAAITARFPDVDAAALAYACRNHLAVVQVPPRGMWGRSGPVASTTAESWLGRSLEQNPSLDDMVLRYFGAFGPATVADVAAWSRLTGLREVVERLRPRLRTFVDARGRELFDLPDAPRPDPEVPAPARFLPEYDNVLLSHADRTRFSHDTSGARIGNGRRTVHGTVLFDGRVHATWRIERDAGRAACALVVSHSEISKRGRAQIAAEGRRFLRFTEPGAADRVVRFETLP